MISSASNIEPRELFPKERNKTSPQEDPLDQPAPCPQLTACPPFPGARLHVSASPALAHPGCSPHLADPVARAPGLTSSPDLPGSNASGFSFFSFCPVVFVSHNPGKGSSCLLSSLPPAPMQGMVKVSEHPLPGTDFYFCL